jgi:uncharacterized protein
MITFRSLAYPLFGLLIAALPVLLAGSSALVTVSFARAKAQQRRTGLYCGLAGVAFILLDLLSLKALPWLGVSYGPVLFSIVILTCIRAGIYVVWAVVQLRKGRNIERPVAWLPFLLMNVALTILVQYSFYIEPFNLRVSRVEVQAPPGKLSRPVRIVQLSDLHVERITMRERSLIPLVQSLHPDVIVLTGDYLNLSFLHDSLALEETKNLFRQLSAPYGVYAVRGSVDGRDLSKALFADVPVKLLEDRTAPVELPGGKLAIIGVSDFDNEHDGEMIAQLSKKIPEDEYRLLLFHTPDEVLNAARAGIDLYLAGHTHGGQIALPLYGAVFTASVFGKRYESGRYQVDRTILYVSRGIGMEGGFAPRARFMAPPEVVVIDLVPRQ